MVYYMGHMWVLSTQHENANKQKQIHVPIDWVRSYCGVIKYTYFIHYMRIHILTAHNLVINFPIEFYIYIRDEPIGYSKWNETHTKKSEQRECNGVDKWSESAGIPWKLAIKEIAEKCCAFHWNSEKNCIFRSLSNYWNVVIENIRSALVVVAHISTLCRFSVFMLSHAQQKAMVSGMGRDCAEKNNNV